MMACREKALLSAVYAVVRVKFWLIIICDNATADTASMLSKYEKRYNAFSVEI